MALLVRLRQKKKKKPCQSKGKDRVLASNEPVLVGTRGWRCPEVPFKTSGSLAESSRVTQQPFPPQAAYGPIRFGAKTSWVRFHRRCFGLPGSVRGECPDSCYSYLLVVSNSGCLISTYNLLLKWHNRNEMYKFSMVRSSKRLCCPL